MRFFFVLLPGATAAAFLEHSFVTCKPYTLLAPNISGLSHVAFAIALVLVLLTGVCGTLAPRPAWPFASLLSGLLPFSLPCIKVVHLSRLVPPPSTSEFTWQAAASSLPRTVLEAAGPAIALALVSGALLLFLCRRAAS